MTLSTEARPELVAVLGQVRNDLAAVLWVRLALVGALISGLAVWLGEAAIHLLWADNAYLYNFLFWQAGGGPTILWLFPMVEGLSLAFYFLGRRKLTGLDLELQKFDRSGDRLRLELESVVGLEGRCADAQRIREENVLFGTLGVVLFLWSGAPYLSDYTASAVNAFGVWWPAGFVLPVLAVWIGLSLLQRGRLARLQEGVEQYASSWLPPRSGRAGDAGGNASRAAAPDLRSISSSDDSMAGIPELLARSVPRYRHQGYALLLSLCIFGAASIAIAVSGWDSFSKNPLAGGWYNYLFVAEVAGVLPVCWLVWNRWTEASRLLRRASVVLAGPTRPEGADLGSRILGIRQAATVLAGSRHLLESSLLVVGYAAVWLAVCLLFIGTPLGIGGVALVGIDAALALYLPVWFVQSDSTFSMAGLARSCVESLTAVELEFWTRY